MAFCIDCRIEAWLQTRSETWLLVLCKVPYTIVYHLQSPSWSHYPAGITPATCTPPFNCLLVARPCNPQKCATNLLVGLQWIFELVLSLKTVTFGNNLPSYENEHKIVRILNSNGFIDLSGPSYFYNLHCNKIHFKVWY